VRLIGGAVRWSVSGRFFLCHRSSVPNRSGGISGRRSKRSRTHTHRRDPVFRTRERHIIAEIQRPFAGTLCELSARVCCPACRGGNEAWSSQRLVCAVRVLPKKVRFSLFLFSHALQNSNMTQSVTQRDNQPHEPQQLAVPKGLEGTVGDAEPRGTT